LPNVVHIGAGIIKLRQMTKWDIFFFFCTNAMFGYNLPEYLRDPELSINNFRCQLKTFLFAQY